VEQAARFDVDVIGAQVLEVYRRAGAAPS